MTFGRTTIENRGQRFPVDIAAPGAGNEIVYTLPANYDYSPVCFQFRLFNDATVANRVINLAIETAAGLRYAYSGPMPALTAGLSRFITYQFGAQKPTAFDPSNSVPMPFHRDMIMTGGDIIRTITTNLQAGDQYLNVTALFQRFAI